MSFSDTWSPRPFCPDCASKDAEIQALKAERDAHKRLNLTIMQTNGDLIAERDRLRELVGKCEAEFSDIASHSVPPFQDTKWLNYARDVAREALRLIEAWKKSFADTSKEEKPKLVEEK